MQQLKTTAHPTPTQANISGGSWYGSGIGGGVGSGRKGSKFLAEMFLGKENVYVWLYSDHLRPEPMELWGLRSEREGGGANAGIQPLTRTLQDPP